MGILALVGHFTEFKDPLEERINNPQKYKDMPCFEVEFNKEKYCFDQGRIIFKNKYISRTTKEDQSAVIYFLPKALSKLPSEEREVRVDWRVDKYHSNNINEPERFVRSFIEDKSRRGSDNYYDKLIQNSKDNKFFEVTEMMENYWISGINKNSKYFIYSVDKRILMKVSLNPSNKYFKFIADIVLQIPTEKNYFEVHFISNQPTEQEFLQTALEIAQEFNQFLTDSKVKNQSLSTNPTTK